MQKITTLLITLLIAKWVAAQPQVTVTLITEQGVTQMQAMEFTLSRRDSNGDYTKPNTFSRNGLYFTFNNFSNNGVYANTNLFQYSKNIPLGSYRLDIQLNAAKTYNLTDSITIDSSAARTEVYIYFSSNEDKEGHIKEIKIITYKRNANLLNFISKTNWLVGTNAEFIIKNDSHRPVYGYPNPTLFFGTLYEEIGRDEWTRHYPKSIDIKFCDTLVTPLPLSPGQTATAWTPDEKTCAPYKFIRKGNYYFELLYSTDRGTETQQGLTKLKKFTVYRQIAELAL